ncbi:ArnT family glycosyltransferase [Ferruginibacter sp.]
MNYKKRTIWLIIIATLIRCITAGSIELGNDEVYYRLYAQHLQWNYFDHPPMVGWLIRLTTFNLFADNEFFIRLGAIIAAAGSTWFLFLSGKKLQDERTGFLAAFIYTCTIYGSIIAGTFILPDSPQMLCWTAGLYLLIGITANKTIDKTAKNKLLLFGLVAGIGMLCKIHTVFLWLAFLLYIIFYNRQWWKTWALYAAGIISLLLFYPVIQWNIDNHFVTYLYHSNRVTVTDSGFNINSFLTFATGQFFYYNPVIFVLMIPAVMAAFSNKLSVSNAHKRLLLLGALPLILLATAIAFFRDVLPHWTGPGYCGLVLLTACYFSRKNVSAAKSPSLPRPLIFAAALITTITIAGIFVVDLLPGRLGKKDKEVYGEGDFTLDMYGWKGFKKIFSEIAQQDVKNGVMKRDAVIVCNKWFPAAHIDQYIAMPLKKDVVAIGDTNDIHQYAWINSERKKLQPGDDAYCIVPSNYPVDVKAVYKDHFAVIDNPVIIEQKRNGSTCRYFSIWRLHNYLLKQNPPAY